MSVVEPYNLAPEFERAVLALCCQNPRFWSRVGHVLDLDAMGHPLAKHILVACAQISAEVGHGPSASIIVLQRLQRLVDDGKLRREDIAAVVHLLDQAEDAGLPELEQAVNELVPVVRRRMHSQALIASHAEYAKQGDFESVAQMLERARAVGASDQVAGVRLGAEAVAEIAKMSTLDRLPTGILELDLQLNDGLARGQLGVAMGDAGSGKSQFLTSQGAEGLRRQLFAGIATLELPQPVQLARVIANLTGVAVNDILEVSGHRDEAGRRLREMTPHIGRCSVAEFPPHATTVRDILQWVVQEEDEAGAPMDLLVVDYADKLHEPRVKDGNSYVEMRYVYESLRRDIAVAKNMWVWTASQAGRPDKGSAKRIDLQHVADSMHKVRVADLVLTLNVRDDGVQIEFYVAKNRTGKSRFAVGPVPTDFERGRIVPITREWTKW